MNAQKVIEILGPMLDELSMHDCEKVRLHVAEHIKENFIRPKTCKRGKLPPYITAEKWERLIRLEHNEKNQLAYILMRRLALRVGEVVRIRLQDLHLENRELYIITEKSKKPDIVYIDDVSHELLLDHIHKHHKEITDHDGHVFFPSKWSNSSRLYISSNTIRNKFRAAVEKAGFQFAYGKAYRQNRVLNLYTTHSCRHSGITDFYLRTRDIVATQKYARHQDIKSTMVYVHMTMEDLKDMVLNPQQHRITVQEIQDLTQRIELLEAHATHGSSRSRMQEKPWMT